jgi:hypothetical protein
MHIPLMTCTVADIYSILSLYYLGKDKSISQQAILIITILAHGDDQGVLTRQGWSRCNFSALTHPR